MSVWFTMHVGIDAVGDVDIRRVEWLDLSDREALADVVSTYEVDVDGVRVGTVRHRYGDGAYRLVELACGLICRGR